VVVDITKLREYCLSDLHPRGRHKARVFRSRLGLTAASAEMLRQALLNAAATNRGALLPTGTDRFGERLILDFEMTTEIGTATIRSGWILSEPAAVLRFVTCYILS
jgi:hypothetical protein